MQALIVLLLVFAVSLIGTKFFYGPYEYALSGRIALSAMLVFTAIGHFAYTSGMSLMLPLFIPFKTEVVLLTGIIEILFAIGLFFPFCRKLVACLLIVYLILVLPANIYASIKQLNYQKGTFNGNGLVYLWFRIPLQILFVVWTYLCAIKPST